MPLYICIVQYTIKPVLSVKVVKGISVLCDLWPICLYIYICIVQYTIKPVLIVEVGKGISVLCDLAFLGGEGGDKNKGWCEDGWTSYLCSTIGLIVV